MADRGISHERPTPEDITKGRNNFLRNALSINPREANAPSYREVIKYEGNEQLRALLVELDVLQKLPNTDPSKKSQLEQLVRKLEALRSDKSIDDDDSDKTLGKSHSDDVTPVLQMAQAELNALSDPILHPELQQGLTSQSSDAAIDRYLPELSEFKNLDSYLTTDLQALLNDKSKDISPTEIETRLTELSGAIDRLVAASSPNPNSPDLAEQIKNQEAIRKYVDEQKKRVEQARKDVFAEWENRFTQRADVLGIERVLAGDRLGQSNTVLLRTLETMVTRVNELTSQIDLPQYQDYLRKFLERLQGADGNGGKIKALLDEWAATVEKQPFENPTSKRRYSIEKVRAFLKANYDNDDKISAMTDADFQELSEAVEAFENEAKNQDKDWSEVQKNAWKKLISLLKITAEKATEMRKSKGRENEVAEDFIKKLELAESGRPKKMQLQDDEVREFLRNIEGELKQLRGNVNESEYQRLEEKYILFKFRYIKRAIINQIYSDMVNGSSHTSYVGKAQEALFENKLTEIETHAIELRSKGRSQLATEIDRELAIFRKKFAAFRLAFYSGSTLEPIIMGAKDATAGAQRKIPLQAPDWFYSSSDLIYSYRGGTEITSNPELKFAEEKPYNQECPPRLYKIPDFENPGNYIENPDYIATVRSDCRRILDMVAKNTLRLRLKSKIKDENRQPSSEEQRVIGILEGEDLFKSVHIEQYNQRVLPEVLTVAARTLYGDEVTFEEAREVWYEYIVSLHFSFMSPGSPSNDDQIYKAGQAIKYIAEGSLAGTTAASAVHMASVVGVYNPKYDGQGGAAYFFDRYVVRATDLSKPHSFTERIGMGLSGVQVEEGQSKNRSKVIAALESAHLYEDYAFLADLPFLVSHRNVWNIIPVVPSPLAYMLFKNPGGPTYSRNKSEVPIMRWGGVTQDQIDEGFIPRPITGADFVTPVRYEDNNGNMRTDYDILYEMIPVEQALETTTIDKWYNNGKNIESLRKMLYDPTSEDIFDPTKVAALQNDDKYIVSFLPDEMGMNVSAGTYDGKKVFQRMTIVSVFARCLDLLTDSALTLDKVEEKMLRLMRVLGEGQKNANAVEAIIITLKQIVGTEEESQRSAQLVLDQLTKSLGYQH